MHWAYKISFKILSGWLIIVPEISGGQFLPHPVYITNFRPTGKYCQKFSGGGTFCRTLYLFKILNRWGNIAENFRGRGTLFPAACIYGAGCCQSGLIRCVCGLIDWALSRVPRVTDRPHRQGEHDSAGH